MTDPSGPLERLQGRLDAFREIHEHWELEEAMTEAEFDQWLHDQMREQKQAIAALSVLPHPQQAEHQKCADCNGTGTRMYAREVSDGCDRCNATGALPSDPRQEPT